MKSESYLPNNINLGGSENNTTSAKKKIHTRRQRTPDRKVIDSLIIWTGEQKWQPEHQAALEDADMWTHTLLASLGIEAIHVPRERIHLLSNESYKSLHGDTSCGLAVILNHEIFINIDLIRSNVYLIDVLIHELLHLKSGMEFVTESEGEPLLTKHGLRTRPEHASKSIFNGLDEAVVAGTTAMLLLENCSPEQIDSYRKKHIREFLQPIPGNPDTQSKVFTELSLFEKIRLLNGAYKEQQEVLFFICESISKKFHEEYPSPEILFNLFIQALLRDSMSLIEGLIENTFGEGSFQLVGTMDIDKESSNRVLLELKSRVQTN